MGKLDTVEVNGPEGEVVDWDAVDWRAVEDDVRRLRHRIFTEGLLEPGASKRRTPGSEGAAAQQCAAATRLADLVLPARGGGVVGAAGQRPGCEECAGPAQNGQTRCCLAGQADREGPAAALLYRRPRSGDCGTTPGCAWI